MCRFDNAVQHFKVLRDGAGKNFLWVVKFDSLNQLIDYHRTSSVSRTQNITLRDTVNKTVKAKYDFMSHEANELPMQVGDVITVIEEVDNNWWRGRNTRTGAEGLFPVPYVEK